MTENKAKRLSIIYNLVRLVVFNLVLLPVFFVGQTFAVKWGMDWQDRAIQSWPVYAVSLITISVLFVLSYQWNVMDRDEKRAAAAEREASEALAEQV
jgi:protein-S-isoprenylcysteine O-methyltransferase Ste14